MTSVEDLKDLPLYRETGLPRFDKIRAEHVAPAITHTLQDLERQLSALEQSGAATWEDLVLPLEDIDDALQRSWGPVGHLHSVCDSPALREAYQSMLGKVVEFSLRYRQSEPIYLRLKAIFADKKQMTSQSRRRVVEQAVRDAEHAGIGLQGEKRQRFNEIARELSELTTKFGNNVLDATRGDFLVLEDPAEMEGLPESLWALAAQEYNHSHPENPVSTPAGGPWLISLNASSYVPFMENSKRADLREKLYRKFVGRAGSGELDNSQNIDRILALKREKAQLLGFDTFAELSLSEKMARGVYEVDEMHRKLLTAARPFAQKELERLRAFAREQGETKDFQLWDVAFWQKRFEEKTFSFTDEEVQQYFSMEKVVEGLFGLAERLFSIRIESADGKAPVWHKDVRYFVVRNTDGSQVGSFYLDPFVRPGEKRPGAWMNICLNRKRRDGKLELPVAYIVCNGTPPVAGRPSLMKFSEVQTLFHEFGHCLQHVCTEVDDMSVSGIHGVEWDAVELASQFMENWCFHKNTLRSLTSHVKTGLPMPESLIEKLVATRSFFSGMQMVRQIYLGQIDMELYHRFTPGKGESVFQRQQKIANDVLVLPLLPQDRTLCSFQHIFAGGYAAGYYSYKWAQVLSADAFAAFEEAGLDDPQAMQRIGMHYRKTILAKGGSEHPAQLFAEFRGRPPEVRPLLRHAGLDDGEE